MTAPQLRDLLRWAIRYVDIQNKVTRQVCTNPTTKRIHSRKIALDVAKTDMWLVKARRGLAKPKAARKPK